MTDKQRILLVDDDRNISHLIRLYLEKEGFEVCEAARGDEGLAAFKRQAPSLVLLDVMLPGVDGFQLLSPLRERGIPVIYLTAKNDLESKLQGLREGAEDYIVKPFEILELLVRIEKVLARYGSDEPVIRVGGVEIHTQEHTAFRDGEPIALSPILFELLLLFARKPNIAMSRERILSSVWGDCFLGESRTVDIHISQLRKKTGLHIVSIPKIGYRLEV